MAPISRRGFVKSSGLALGLASWPVGLPVAGAAKRAGLGPARKRTFTALVTTVSAAGDDRFRGPELRAAGAAFDAWYVEAPAAVRELVERTLDGIENAGRSRFSRMSPNRRLAVLRGWRYGKREDRRGLAYDAVVLASAPFGPPPYAPPVPEDV